MSLPWSQFPSNWMKPAPGGAGDNQIHPLAELQWSRHKGSAIAAILVLMALSIRLNQANRKVAFVPDAVRPTKVGVTFDDLRDMTGLAKATISTAIGLLQGFSAIDIHQEGRANLYELKGLDVDGGWCKLPQGWLVDRSGNLKIKEIPRNRRSLNALKLYLLMLMLRDRKTNTTAVSFTTITLRTGIRREDIAMALGTLFTIQLLRLSPDRDIRHQLGDNSHRYSILGLGNTIFKDADLLTEERALFLEAQRDQKDKGSWSPQIDFSLESLAPSYDV